MLVNMRTSATIEPESPRLSASKNRSRWGKHSTQAIAGHLGRAGRRPAQKARLKSRTRATQGGWRHHRAQPACRYTQPLRAGRYKRRASRGRSHITTSLRAGYPRVTRTAKFANLRYRLGAHYRVPLGPYGHRTWNTCPLRTSGQSETRSCRDPLHIRHPPVSSTCAPL